MRFDALLRRCFLAVLIVTAVLVAGGCRKPPTIENYEREGLRFRHSSDEAVSAARIGWQQIFDTLAVD